MSLVFAMHCFLHPVSHFSLFINLTEAPNMMGFPPPQLPQMIFLYDSILLSYFFLHHNHHDLDPGLFFFLHSSFPLSTYTSPEYKEMEDSEAAQWCMGIALSLNLPKYFIWKVLSFSWCKLLELCCPAVELRLYTSKRPGGL